ncbi:MAG: DUF3299 domain-containing protein [Planctomycetes bacterium]|nr:DUF3299 domain-containing protein [Planctomycetota bacterium]
MSRGAIAAVILAALSPLFLVFPTMGVFPVAGGLVGVLALRTIARYPREISGWWAGMAGSVVCGGIFAVGAAWHAITYATEVPNGYARISFQVLQPDARRPAELIPQAAVDLNGKKVFIKGYIHPSVDGLGAVRQFVLVPDMGTCCFGGQPKLTDMIEVTTNERQRVFYTRRKLRLAGTLKVDTALKRVDGLTGVFYQMAADAVR